MGQQKKTNSKHSNQILKVRKLKEKKQHRCEVIRVGGRSKRQRRWSDWRLDDNVHSPVTVYKLEDLQK